MRYIPYVKEHKKPCANTECPWILIQGHGNACGMMDDYAMHNCKGYTTEQQEQEERSCETCVKFNKTCIGTVNGKKYCKDWKSEQNQPKRSINVVTPTGIETVEERQSEQKSSAEWELIKADKKNHLIRNIQAINNNAEGILKLREELSALKERFVKAEVRYCKQFEMISSINDKIDQRDDENGMD